MRKENVILTFSGKAHGGKDTCVSFVRDEFEKQGKSVFCLAFGDYVKTLCSRNFGYNEEFKEDYRDMLQKFGTDIVRSTEEDFWVRIVFNTIDMLSDIYDVFLISDARFLNELQPYPYRMSYPIFNVLIKRNMEDALTEDQEKHISEDLANNPPKDLFHIVINNNEGLDELEKMSNSIVQFILTIQENYEEINKQNTDEGINDLFGKMVNEMEFDEEDIE